MKFGFAALSVGLLCSAAAFAGNIVVNPGFETGDFTGWPGNGGWIIETGPDDGVIPHSGAFYADTGCVGPGCISNPDAFFFQDLATTIGQTYTFSFYYDLGETNTGGLDSDFAEVQALWNGSVVLDATSTDLPDAGYVFFTVDEMATSTTTEIEFLGRQDPAEAGVDDVCVDVQGGACSGASGVPEPGTMSLLSGGMSALLLLGFVRRRSSQARNQAHA